MEGSSNNAETAPLVASERAAPSVVIVKNPYASKPVAVAAAPEKPTLTSRELILQHLDLPQEEQLLETCESSTNVDTEPSSENNPTAASSAFHSSSAGTTTTPLSNIEFPLHRLPSQELTFGSAEILTIFEYLQHCAAFCNKSVRLTGKLAHRTVHSASMVSLVLTDPLAVPPPTSTARRRQPSLGGRHPVHRGVNLLSKTPLLSGRRRPSMVLKKTPGGLRTPSNGATTMLPTPSSRTPGSALPSSRTTTTTATMDTTRKRPRSSTPKPPPPSSDPVEALVSALTSCGSVWIVANPQHVLLNDSVEGDLMMIMGEVRLASFGHAQGGNQETINHDHETIVARIAHELSQQRAKKSDSSVEDGNVPIYFVRARISRNANGTDMKLFTQALLARRKYLRDAFLTSNKENPDSDKVIRPGCGPPL